MVNNAAIIVDGLVLDTSEDDLDRVLAVNFKGVFFGCQAAGRVMVDQRSGSIINMASGAIDIPTPALVCYATAKAAVAQLSRTLAMELAPHQVRVNAIAPGWIDTPMNERHARRPDGTLDEEKQREYIAMRAKLSPMGTESYRCPPRRFPSALGTIAAVLLPASPLVHAVGRD